MKDSRREPSRSRMKWSDGDMLLSMIRDCGLQAHACSLLSSMIMSENCAARIHTIEIDERGCENWLCLDNLRNVGTPRNSKPGTSTATTTTTTHARIYLGMG